MIINILKLIFLVFILIFIIIIICARSQNGRQEKLRIPKVGQPGRIVESKSKNKFYKIVVGGTVLNCKPYLSKVFENIKSIISLYSTFKIIIAYDEGKDQSLRVLEEIRDTMGHQNMTILKGKKTSKYRTENISNARNKVLVEAAREYHSDSFYHFIMMDMDNVNAVAMDLKVYKKGIRRNKEWDALSFNRKPYYDIWALSYPPYYMSVFNWEKQMVQHVRKDITTQLADMNQESLFPCFSAFNGFSIYRADLFLRSRYDWKFSSNMIWFTEEMKKQNIDAFAPVKFKEISPIPGKDGTVGPQDCEHRFFHYYGVLVLGARVMISPQILFQD